MTAETNAANAKLLPAGSDPRDAKPAGNAKPLAARKPAAPKPVTGKPARKAAPTVAELVAAAVATALEAERAKSPVPARKEGGYRAWATKDVTPAMEAFTCWIAREFPELGALTARDARLVMIASKAYKAFQGSDLGTGNF
jgi:hypothetical protein